MEVTLESYAKINLALKVLFQRPDEYHELRTIFQTIQLSDTIVIRSRNDNRTLFTCDDPDLPGDESNLCIRALDLFRRKTGKTDGVEIFLYKRIPSQAGLGGGSSNAASVLRGLCRLYHMEDSTREWMASSAELGADVPFFLLGGTALGIGRGDEIIPLPDLPARWVLVVSPEVSISTSWAYGRLKLVLTLNGVNTKISPSFRGLTTGEVFLEEGENDFEVAIFPEYPQLRRVKEQLLNAGAAKAMLSGSGSSLFGLFESEERCGKAEEALRSAGFIGRIFRSRFVSCSEYQRAIVTGRT